MGKEHAHEGLSDWTIVFQREARLRAPLQNAEVSSSLCVGIAGTSSPLAYEFVRLLGEPDAERAFVDLLDRGAPGARLYALCGLTVLKTTDIAAHRALVEVDHRDVAIMQGCSLSVVSIREAATSAQVQAMCDELVEVKRETSALELTDGAAPTR